MISDLAKVLGGNSSLLAATTSGGASNSTSTATATTAKSVSNRVNDRQGQGKLEDHLKISNDAPGVVSITAKVNFYFCFCDLFVCVFLPQTFIFMF